MFASQAVDAASVAASQILMGAQLRDRRHSIEVVHKLKKVASHTFQNRDPHSMAKCLLVLLGSVRDRC